MNTNSDNNMKPSATKQINRKPPKEYVEHLIDGKVVLILKGSDKWLGGRIVLCGGDPFFKWSDGEYSGERYVGPPKPPKKVVKTYPRPVPRIIGGQMVLVTEEHKDSKIEVHKGSPYIRERVDGYMASAADAYCGGEYLVYIGPGEDPQFKNLNKNLFVGTILVLGLLYLWFNLLF
jgi:hypothetical protein